MNWLLLALACRSGNENVIPTETSQPAEPTTLVPSGSYSVPGELQTLFSINETPWAVSQSGGDYQHPLTTSLFRLDGGAFTWVDDLPNADQRSYQWFQNVTLNGQNYILANYTSNSAINGQNGTEHGLLVIDSEGHVVADHDLAYAYGITGASAFALNPNTGKVYVLANNTTNVSDRYDNVSFGQSAIVEIDNPLNPQSSFSIIKIPSEYKNASSMAYRDEKLIVGAAGNYWEQGASANVLAVDLSSGDVTSLATLPAGDGLNGPIQSSQDGSFIFTGENADQGSLVVLNAQNKVQSYKVPEGYQGYVANAQWFGNQFLFNTNNAGETSTLLLASNKTSALLNQTSSLYGVAPIQVSADYYCDGAAGADIDTTGQLSSLVTCYSAQ